ncbi:MFS transporter [Streptomyces rubradiris]|uniref:MFS transporter n=1 Tax=Streptomyces rubradiris TaxID=285531 RepID=A0ABQ3RR52_STRRR|nr:MFS transporter [Streptomyces rubradiris]GHI52010.1 MFS transporter [Streptomyces rubradiris]GHI52880.1 MFS transporter [Streptomyces rubradiris]GHI58329.1 MFS transporter [Streptomyces rubradiris]
MPPALAVACFLSNFDRFAITPLLMAIATGFHVRLGQVVLVASGYFFAYGCAQPVWGMLSDRYGRMRVIRFTLCAAAVCGLVSAAAPDLTTLVILRIATGAFFGAVVPASLTYVGDTVPAAVRQRALSDLQLALAIGTAAATLVAGAAAALFSWRVMLALSAVLAAVTVAGMRGLSESRADTTLRRPSEQLASVLRRRWSWLVMAFGLVEGAVLLGCFTFLAPALEDGGIGALGAGGVTALYGAGTLGFSRLLKRVAMRPAWSLLAAGGVMMAGGFLVAAAGPNVWGIGAAAILLGGGWSFFHSSLQNWATTLVPEARGTAVALFVASLFVGSAIGSGLGGTLAQHGHYQQLFLLAAATAVPLTVCAAWLRTRYTPTGS